MENRLFTHFIDMVTELFKLEQAMWRTNEPGDVARYMQYRERVEQELQWLDSQRKKALLRINPPFNI